MYMELIIIVYNIHAVTLETHAATSYMFKILIVSSHMTVINQHDWIIKVP